MDLIRKWYLFQEFNKTFTQTNFFHGYRLYAVECTDVHMLTLPDDNGTFYCANDNSKGYNLMHLNALYDLLNRRYIDAILQDSREENENKALISIIENIQHDSIITADRNTHYHYAIGFNYRLS